MALHRRTLLRTGFAGGIAALAGCSNSLAGGSEGATFADWLYAPGTVADTDHYLSLRYEPAAIADRAGEFDGDVYDALRAFGSSARDTVGFRFAGTDVHLAFGKNSVLTADFEASEVVSTLKDDEFVAGGSYGGFDQYLGPDENTAVGVGSDAVVVARSSGIFGSGVQAPRILQAIADAHNGDTERYADASADFETLTGALGDGALQSARTHPETDETDTEDGEFAGEVARGIDSTLTDEGIETTFALVFTDGSAVDAVAVEDWVAANRNDGTFATFESVEVSTDGRTALVTGTEPTAEYDFYLRDF